MSAAHLPVDTRDVEKVLFGMFMPQGWKMELSSIDGAEAKWQTAVDVAIKIEELGYDSLWVYDHVHNVPKPAHEAVFECWTTLAAISQRTSRVRLGQMVGCNSYRQPGLLAKITSNVDVISGGRLEWGIGAGWYENEYKGYGYEFPRPKERIGMLRETVEIVKSMWSAEETTFHGDHYSMERAQCDPKPLQTPHPPIGVAGLSKGSDTLKLAGEKGYIPMSLNLNPAYVKSHWESVEIGAAKSGRTPDRNQWRLVREVFVADTDEEAMRLSVGSHMGRMMREYFLPLLSQFGFFEYLKHDAGAADSDVTPEYCAKHNWIVGSPKTVVEKIEKIYEEVGGFGQLLVFGFDYVENPQAWRRSLELLSKEVMPKVQHLKPGMAKLAAE